MATFGHPIAGRLGWSRLYAFSWFYTCTVSSVIYFALSFVGNYAVEEKAMPFEHLAGSGGVEEIQAVEPESDVSEVNLPVEQKV